MNTNDDDCGNIKAPDTSLDSPADQDLGTDDETRVQQACSPPSSNSSEAGQGSPLPTMVFGQQSSSAVTAAAAEIFSDVPFAASQNTTKCGISSQHFRHCCSRAAAATGAWARPWHRRRRRRTAGDSCPTCAEALCQPDCAHDPHKGGEACNASAPVMSCSGCAALSSTVGFGGTCVCTCSSPADFLFVLAPILGGISLVLCLCFARTYRRDEFMSVGESRRRRSGYTAASVTDGDL